MPTWTLNDTALATYGITAAILTLRNQASDELVLTLDGDSDAGSAFTPDSAWNLKLDAERIFCGTVKRPGRALSGSAEGRRIVIEGPWARMERIIYQQRYPTYSAAGARVANDYRYHSRVLLGQDEAQGKIFVGLELARIIAYASGRVLVPNTPRNDGSLYTVPSGAPLQLGTIPDGPTPPAIDLSDVSCAEAIRALLRFMPDAIVRFDYATTPPTLSIARRASATVSTLPAYSPATPATPPDPEPVELDITPRYDLQVPLVVLKFARGVQAGSYINPAFWLEYAGDFSGVEIAAAGWSVTLDDPSPGVEGALVQTIELQDDDFAAVGGTGEREGIPFGLAIGLRAALSELHYEGSFTREGVECVPGTRPGDLLNLSGGRTEWATMRAQIQTITHDLTKGATTLDFGPAAHLGAGDWLELLRGNRIGLRGPKKTKPGKTSARDSSIPALILTLERPAGYTEAEASTKGWVTWGHVDSVVVDNIAASYTLAAGLKVYVKVTTNGAIPLRVLTAEIDATTSTRTDTGGTASTPATTAYYLLGEVLGAGTVLSPYTPSNSGSGNLVSDVIATGYTCVLASAGDPSATPPVPASLGGVRTDYQFRLVRGS